MKKSPLISNNWCAHRENVNTFFGYPADIRRVIHITDATKLLINVIHAAIEKVKVFSTDNPLRKYSSGDKGCAKIEICRFRTGS